MDHAMPSSGSTGIDAAALAVRLVLLLATAVVAGSGLFTPTRWKIVTAVLAGVSAVLALVSAFSFGVNLAASIIHVLLVVAVAVLVFVQPRLGRWAAVALLLLVVVETSLGRSGLEFATDTVYVGSATVYFGLTATPEEHRPARWRQLSLSLGLLLVLAGAGQLLLSGVAFDRRLYETFFGVSLIAVVLLPVLALSVRRIGVYAVAVAFLAWSCFAALPHPADLPVPGVPLLTTAAGSPVLVSPQRPGRNLVHFPASAGDGISVSGVPATPRPGAEGTWAEVELPAGRSDLVVHKGNTESTVEVDAGQTAGPPTAVGPDGPECASAALGDLAAGRKNTLTSCPSDTLSEEDADSLRKLTSFLGTREAGTITLVADSSPRGTAAAEVVRQAAAKEHLAVTDQPVPKSALVVVSGWAGAYNALTAAARAQAEAPTYTYGLYVAPWLLSGPIVNTVSSSAAPLRFDPRQSTAVGFTVALGEAFGGESPTLGGFRRWLGPGEPPGKVQLYATAQVNAMPMTPGEPEAPGWMTGEGPGHWVPGGTVVPVSFPLE